MFTVPDDVLGCDLGDIANGIGSEMADLKQVTNEMKSKMDDISSQINSISKCELS